MGSLQLSLIAFGSFRPSVILVLIKKSFAYRYCLRFIEPLKSPNPIKSSAKKFDIRLLRTTKCFTPTSLGVFTIFFSMLYDQ